MEVPEAKWDQVLYIPFPDQAQELGIAVVGAGAIVNAAHLPAYQMAGLSVRGIYDIDGKRAQMTQQRFQLPRVYQHFAEILSDPGVAIVDLAVPARHQFGLLEQALQAGKHVLCQKPLATSRRELQQIRRLVRQYPECQVAVNQQMRWSPLIRSLKQVLEQGSLGTPVLASMQVSVHTDWTAWPWLLAEPHLLSLFNTIHLVDSFRFLFGTPGRVYARGQRVAGQPSQGETHLLMSLEYESPLIGWLHDHHNNESPDRYATVRCEGSQGVAKGTIGIWDHYPHGQPDSFEWTSRSQGRWVVHRPAIATGWVPGAFQGPMADLMFAIAEGHGPSVSVEDNAKTLATVFAAVDSMEAGRVIPVQMGQEP